MLICLSVSHKEWNSISGKQLRNVRGKILMLCVAKKTIKMSITDVYKEVPKIHQFQIPQSREVPFITH